MTRHKTHFNPGAEKKRHYDDRWLIRYTGSKDMVFYTKFKTAAAAMLDITKSRPNAIRRKW